MNINQESLEIIRFKATNKQTDLSTRELSALEEVYYEITKNVNGKGIVLDKSCSSCIKQAMVIVHNYVTYHEVKAPVIEVRQKATVIIKKVETDYTDFTKMSYQELKKLAAKNGYQGATPKKDDLLKFLNATK